MARSDLDRFGILNLWPRFMLESIWRYNQIIGEGVEDAPDASRHIPYIQRERDMIAIASTDAANAAWLHLGFPPAPVWLETTLTLNSDRGWLYQSLELPDGHVSAIGRRAVASLGTATVIYDDTNNDYILDTATVTITLTGDNVALDQNELGIFFRVEDGAAAPADDRWKITPLTISRTGNDVTFRGHKALFTSPAIWGKEYTGQTGTSAKHAGRPQNADDFVYTVDIYRVYSDPSTAVELLSTHPETGQSIAYASASLVNPLEGIIELYKATNQTAPTYKPHSVRVSYRAGLDFNQPMSNTLLSAIFRYANVLMPQSVGFFDRTLQMWTQDREISKEVLAADARNPPPFGISVGGMYLWKTIRPEGFRMPLKAKVVHQS